MIFKEVLWSGFNWGGALIWVIVVVEGTEFVSDMLDLFVIVILLIDVKVEANHAGVVLESFCLLSG